MNAINDRRPNIVLDKSFAFALEVVALYQRLTEQREFVLAKQLLRSGTSIGANVEEAQAGQSHADFTAKMSVALKEARESRYWLRLLHQSQLVQLDFRPALANAEEVLRILTAIVKSAHSRS